jgi:hypothetical protein
VGDIMSNVQVTFKKIAGFYYINIKDDFHDLSLDYDIANYIKVNMKTYKNVISRFNAVFSSRGIAFKSQQDVLNAIEWIDSMVLMNKLMEN